MALPIDVSNIKLLNRDIMVRLKERGEIEGYSLIIRENTDADPNQFFTVVRASEQVTMFKEGDVVIIPWPRITDPFEGIYNGEKGRYGITSEDEVLCVIEE